MAEGTLQILGLGTSAVPLDYQVAGNQPLDLLAVKADFDGTSAGSDFVPVVEILSDASHVMAQSQGSTVTAGDSATVTFAPFLRGQTAGVTPAAGGTQILVGSSPSVNSGNAATIGYSSYSGQQFFDISGGGIAPCLVAGNYAFTASIELQSSWPATAYSRLQIEVNSGVGPFPIAQVTAGPFGATISFPSYIVPFTYPFTAGEVFELSFFNGHPTLARSCKATVVIQAV